MPKKEASVPAGVDAVAVDQAAKRTLESFGEAFESGFVREWAAICFPPRARAELEAAVAAAAEPSFAPAAAAASEALVAATVHDAVVVDTDVAGAQPLVLFVVAAVRGARRCVQHRSFAEFRDLHRAVGAKAKRAKLPRDPSCPARKGAAAAAAAPPGADALKRCVGALQRYLSAVASDPRTRRSPRLHAWLRVDDATERDRPDAVVSRAFDAAWRAVGGGRFAPALRFDGPAEGLAKLLVAEAADAVRPALAAAPLATYRWLVRRLAPAAEQRWATLVERTDALRRELAETCLADVAPARDAVFGQVRAVVAPVLDPLVAEVARLVAQALALFERPVTRAMHTFIGEKPSVVETLRIFAVSSPETLEESDFDRLEVQLSSFKEKVLGTVMAAVPAFLDGLKAVAPANEALVPSVRVMAKLPVLARAVFLLANQANPVSAAKAFTKQRVALLKAGPASAAKILASMPELDLALFVAKRDMEFDVWRVIYAVQREAERAYAADSAGAASLTDLAPLIAAFRDFGERLALVQYGAMRKLVAKFSAVLKESAQTAPEANHENWTRLLGVATDQGWQSACKYWTKRAWPVAVTAVIEGFVAFFTPSVEVAVKQKCCESLRASVPPPPLPQGLFAEPESFMSLAVHDAVEGVVRPVLSSWFSKL